MIIHFIIGQSFVFVVHTTHVNFQIANLSAKQLTIHINHTNTERVCSGHISQVDDQKTLTAVQVRKSSVE